MIRYKILGGENFAADKRPNNLAANKDSGNFRICHGQTLVPEFEEITPPPERLRVRYSLEYSPCSPIAVIKGEKSAVWQPSNERCGGVTLAPTHIVRPLNGGAEIDSWRIERGSAKLDFKQAPTIYLSDEVAIHLWPCGGKADMSFNPEAIEQLYAEPSPDLNLGNTHVTPSRNWRRYGLAADAAPKLHGDQSVFFYPPYPKVASLGGFIDNGLVKCHLTDGDGLSFAYKSVGFERTAGDLNHLNVIFERNDGC